MAAAGLTGEDAAAAALALALPVVAASGTVNDVMESTTTAARVEPLLSLLRQLPTQHQFHLAFGCLAGAAASFTAGRYWEYLVHHGTDRELGPGGAVAVSQLKPGDPPLPEDIPRTHLQAAEIASLEKKPVLRNLLITQCYHDISVGLSAILNPPGQTVQHANWCTIAQWASKNVGAFIRQEFLPEVVRGLLRQHDGFRTKVDEINDQSSQGPREMDAHGHRVRTLVGRGGMLDVAQYIAGEITEYMIEGNLKVFAELGPIFGRLIDCYRFDDAGQPVCNVVAFNKLITDLLPGPAQPTPTDEGQEMLKQALGFFRAAVEQKDQKTKAELVLLFNVYTGLHEQTRLQPCIEGSLDVGPKKLFEQLIGKEDHVRARREARWWPFNWIGRAHTALDKRLLETWRLFSTRFSMTLPIPGQQLYLGAMMPKPRGSATFFPPVLATLEHVAFDEKQLQLYGSTFTEDHPDKHRIGAGNWADLDQRMKFIFGLFRSRHSDPAIFDEPFQPKVRDLIVNERLVPRNAML